MENSTSAVWTVPFTRLMLRLGPGSPAGIPMLLLPDLKRIHWLPTAGYLPETGTAIFMLLMKIRVLLSGNTKPEPPFASPRLLTITALFTLPRKICTGMRFHKPGHWSGNQKKCSETRLHHSGRSYTEIGLFTREEQVISTGQEPK